LEFRERHYLILELEGSSLEKERNDHDDVTFLRNLARDAMCALNELKKLGIAHCDVKTANFMHIKNENAKSETQLKLGDFSLACYVNGNDEYSCKSSTNSKLITIYQAPEVFFGGTCSFQADIWGLGITLLEIVMGEPPLDGSNEKLVESWTSMFGEIPEYLMKASADFQSLQLSSETSTLEEILNSSVENLPETFVDFISSCLRLDPKERITVEDALHHPFIS